MTSIMHRQKQKSSGSVDAGAITSLQLLCDQDYPDKVPGPPGTAFAMV